MFIESSGQGRCLILMLVPPRIRLFAVYRLLREIYIFMPHHEFIFLTHASAVAPVATSACDIYNAMMIKLTIAGWRYLSLFKFPDKVI